MIQGGDFTAGNGTGGEVSTRFGHKVFLMLVYIRGEIRR